MQTVCVSSNWPTVESLHPRQLDIFVHGWQDDCPPPDVNGAAPSVTAPAVPGQGVGIPVSFDSDALLERECGVSYFDCSEGFEWDWALLGPLDAPCYIPRGSADSFVRVDGSIQRDWAVRVR